MPASDACVLQVKRFRSAAEALRRQDMFHGVPFDPALQPGLLAWTSPRALLVAPGESRLAAFETAAQACAEAGWPVAIRRGGGRVCPISPGTLQLAISRPVAEGITIASAYEEMATLLERLLEHFEIQVERGICPDAFCPGRYDLSVAGRKIAGLAQVWRLHHGQRIAITGASLVVGDEADSLADGANLFSLHLHAPPACRSGAIGSLGRAAGRSIFVEDVLGVLQGFDDGVDSPS
jgi:Lipoate-protein ligase A